MVVRRWNDNKAKTKEFEIPVFLGESSHVVGSVNGLLLIKRLPTLDLGIGIDLILWIPSIRKSLKIPLPPLPNLGFTDWGFGYDPVTDDYEVVAIVFDKEQSTTFVEVYNLKTGSWRSIGVNIIAGDWYLGSSVYANGVVHWIAGDYDDDDHIMPDSYWLSHIISFDLGTESFSYIELPDVHEPGVLGRVKIPSVLDGLLAVFCFTSRYIFVWVMRENGWTKECTIETLTCLFFNDLCNEADHINHAIFIKESNELLISLPYTGLISYNTLTELRDSYNCV